MSLSRERPAILNSLCQACRPPSKVLYLESKELVEGMSFIRYLYTLLSNQYGELLVFVKAYAQRQHGQKSIEQVGVISTHDFDKKLKAFTCQASQEIGEPCIPSVSGTFIHQLSGKVFVIPMMDLEISATQSPKNDLLALKRIIEDKGVSGFILRSGDIGLGSYHFSCDFALPYRPYFWKSMGWFMQIMTSSIVNRDIINSWELGGKILRAQSLSEAQIIAQKVLKEYPSIPSGQRREGLLFDPRWCAHKIIAGFNALLRPTAAKDYEHPPRLTADILPPPA